MTTSNQNQSPDPAPKGEPKTNGDTDDLESIWRALADPTRRAILDELRVGPLNTLAICDKFAITRNGVIKHLKVLEAAGLVRVEARGRERINHLNPMPLQQIYERWLKPYEFFWAGNLHRLAAAAEGESDPDPAAATDSKSEGEPREHR